VTGAPGTGKTTLIKDLEQAGYRCYHEVIRSLTADARESGTEKEQVSNPLVFVDDPFKFNTFLLNARKEHYFQSLAVDDAICFFDRGTCDVLAYMDFFNQKYDSDFEEVCSKLRYEQVFILPPWKEIYVGDNERLETFSEAEDLHLHLLETYQRFGYQPIEIPKGTPKERFDFVIELLKQNE